MIIDFQRINCYETEYLQGHPPKLIFNSRPIEELNIIL